MAHFETDAILDTHYGAIFIMSSFASFEFKLIGAILKQSLDAIVRVFHVRKQRTRLGVSFAAQMARESVF